MTSLEVPKSECTRLLDGIFNAPQGMGVKPNIVRVLARCLDEHNITMAEFNKAVDWMEDHSTTVTGKGYVAQNELLITRSVNTGDVDVIGSYINSVTRLYQWIASSGGQIGPLGDLAEALTISATISLAQAVPDAPFRSTVLKAGADYLNRTAEEAVQKAGSESIAA